MQNSRFDLSSLVAEPREALDIEVKDWLNLDDNDHRAALAKEIIALANHGGGFVVIGFTERTDGSFGASPSRPSKLDNWSQDSIQSIVAKYVDPAVQCRVEHIHRVGNETGGRHPVIVVPGGHRVPVRAKAGSPDGKRLVAHRVYVRRAGPSSEEPKTAEEWDRFLERCLQNRQAELLEAMRSIMAGVIPGSTPAKPTREQELTAFEQEAVSRWRSCTDSLPQDSPPRFPHGYYDVGFAIDANIEIVSLRRLRDIVRESVQNYSGWPPFVTLERSPFTPRPVSGAVETWIGPDTDGSYDRPAHHDFWRVAPNGLLFTRRGYQEDGSLYDMPPGKFFDITSPTWRLGEAILEAAHIAQALGAHDGNLICHCQWVGLSGRTLISRGNQSRRLSNKYMTSQDSYEATRAFSISLILDALPEIVFEIWTPPTTLSWARERRLDRRLGGCRACGGAA